MNSEPMFQDPKNWYVVYTKALWEKKFSKQLEQRKIEHYCPLNKVERQWSDRKKIIDQPLFKSYVFVRVREAEQVAIQQIRGFTSFVFWLKKPAIVRDEEIDTIKRFMMEHRGIKLEKLPINVNDRVKILGGSFMSREGNILEIKSKTVKVLLPTLGYTLVVEVGNTNVELLSTSKNLLTI
ncbi:MAG TPA: UpxY family transcription antiterminator [Puia sp.]|nr:UpxY family transcription antiterminator [Puia sp.]